MIDELLDAYSEEVKNVLKKVFKIIRNNLQKEENETLINKIINELIK